MLYAFYMTIKARNRFLLFLFFIGAAMLAVNSAMVVLSALTGSMVPPETAVIRPPFFKGGLSYSFASVVSSILFFGIMAPSMAFIVYRCFEKTSSLEILFFTGFIISCALEEARILLPVLHLWKSSSSLVVFIGRIVVVGRILGPLSLLFASLFSSSDQLEYAERNLFFLFATSCAIGFFYPINSNEISSNCTVLYGMKSLFGVMRLLLLFTSIITISSDAYERGVKIAYLKALGILLIAAGSFFLYFCANAAFLVTGIFIFLIGVVLYLKVMHYMANNWS